MKRRRHSSSAPSSASSAAGSLAGCCRSLQPVWDLSATSTTLTRRRRPVRSRTACRPALGRHDSLATFRRECDLVTYEFENIPLTTLDALNCPVLPGAGRWKSARTGCVRSRSSLILDWSRALRRCRSPRLADALERIGPGILKTRRFGYDGKGQVRLSSGDDLDAAFEVHWRRPGDPRGLCRLSSGDLGHRRARPDGRVSCYDPGENVHEGGILRRTTVPARLSPELVADACQSPTASRRASTM